MLYPAIIPSFTNGSDVSAEDLNLTITPLKEAVEYLRGLLDGYETDGSLTSLRIKNQTLPVGAVTGNVVYHNGTTWALAQAIAMDNGSTEVDPSAFILGVIEPSNTILMVGRTVSITGSNIQLEPGELFRSGPYYVSASNAGCVTKNKPSVAAYVGSVFPTFSIMLPSIRDNADAHLHYAIPLSNTAAGYVFADGGSGDRTFTLYGYRHDAHVTDTAPTYATPVLCGGFNLSTTLTYAITASESGANYVLTWTAGAYSGTLTFDSATELYDTVHTLDGAHGVNLFFRRSSEFGTVDDTTAALFTAGTTKWTLTLPAAGKGWVPTDSGDNGSGTQPKLFDLPESAFDPTHIKQAQYVYNIGYDAAVNDFYPPTPLGTAAYIFNGAELCEYTKFKNSNFAIGYDTLSWIDATARPWIHAEEAGANEPQSTFCFVRRSAGNTGVVTSLAAGVNSPIRFKAKGSTATASTGDLEAYLDLTLTATDTAAAGFNVVKGSLDNALLVGPVVEKVMVGAGLTLTPVAGCPEGQGTVVLSTSGSEGLAGPFDNISLENAKQGKVGMITYVSLPAKTTEAGPGYAFTANFQIPYKSETTPAKYLVRVYGTVFGDKSITDGVEKTCSLNFGYSILPDNYAGTWDKSLADALTYAVARDNIAVTLPVGYTAYDPFKISTDSGILGENFPVSSEIDASLFVDTLSASFGIYVGHGFTVGVRFEAGTGTADYTGNLGFMNLRWELVQVI